MMRLRLCLLLLLLTAAAVLPAAAAASPLGEGLARATTAYASWVSFVRINVGGPEAQAVQAKLLERKLARASVIVGGVRPASASERIAKRAVMDTIAAGVAVAHDALALQAAAQAFRVQGDRPEILRRGGNAAQALRRDAQRFLDLRVRARHLLDGGRR